MVLTLLTSQKALACCDGQDGGFFSSLLENTQISGGLDSRLNWSVSKKWDPTLSGVFLNYRRTFSDDLGDRWILSLQADYEDNLKAFTSYQSFLQYKGPLGKWNVRGGHFLLPFGLLSDYDTERIVLHAHEEETLGVRLDTGVSAFGFFNDWNWAIAATSGLGRRWLNQYEGTGLITTRLGHKFDDLILGLSLLGGTFRPNEEFPIQSNKTKQLKLALDATYQVDQWTARFETLGGTEGEENKMGALQSLVDYALSEKWEINSKYSMISRGQVQHELGGGLTYKLQNGWIIRLADIYRFRKETNENEVTLQVYYDFSKSF